QQDESKQAALTIMLEKLMKQRDRQREKLIKWLDSKTYRKALDRFVNFLTKEGKASREPDTAITPYEVRHVAPTLITEQLNTVRAYDAILSADEMAEPDILHSLRIEFKRLRYTVDFFTDVLG